MCLEEPPHVPPSRAKRRTRQMLRLQPTVTADLSVRPADAEPGWREALGEHVPRLVAAWREPAAWLRRYGSTLVI